ncbi:MAG: hypothetical protein LIR50_19210 [Bacillota bacterium]|nr:hypothetical protein [Bacillota bacterium]
MSKCYGGIINRLLEGGMYGSKEITVGMGVTEYLWSDRHAYEVTKVFSQTHICIRRMNAKVVKGSCQDGSAEYEYKSNPKYQEIEIKRFKNGWYDLRINPNNPSKKIKGYSKYSLSFGVMDEYYDPCF